MIEIIEKIIKKTIKFFKIIYRDILSDIDTINEYKKKSKFPILCYIFKTDQIDNIIKKISKTILKYLLYTLLAITTLIISGGLGGIICLMIMSHPIIMFILIYLCLYTIIVWYVNKGVVPLLSELVENVEEILSYEYKRPEWFNNIINNNFIKHFTRT